MMACRKPSLQFSVLLSNFAEEICPFLFHLSWTESPRGSFALPPLRSLTLLTHPSPSAPLPRALWPLPSTRRRCRSRLRGVLFIIGSDDPRVPPWHRVNYSLLGDYPCPS